MFFYICGKPRIYFSGKPHSFGELKLPSSQTTLSRVVTVKNIQVNLLFIARLFVYLADFICKQEYKTDS